MNPPLISVIIPCYNGAEHLAEAIDSILAQRAVDPEIIVVDDGSADDSGQIAARYPDVHYIRQSNSGVAVARNTGLRHATSEYVVFLDQDDRLLPHALESNLRCLLEQPQCAFSFGDAQVIDGAGAPLSESECAAMRVPTRSSSPHEDTDHYVSLLRGSYIWTPGAVLYRRNVLSALAGFDPRVNPACDSDLNLRIARSYPIRHNKTIVVQKRLHGANQSRHSAVLLRSEMTLLQWQLHCALWNRPALDALQHGVQFYARFYGKPLLRQMLLDLWHRRNWGHIGTGLCVLVQSAALSLAVSVCQIVLRAPFLRWPTHRRVASPVHGS
jgi:GT2 family glycosyltransferase